jgi:hypothetical protein
MNAMVARLILYGENILLRNSDPNAICSMISVITKINNASFVFVNKFNYHLTFWFENT